MNLSSLPPVGQDLERLAIYKLNREIEEKRARALEEERERVEAALKVPEKERTQAERNIIAYSDFGSAPSCHCGF